MSFYICLHELTAYSRRVKYTRSVIVKSFFPIALVTLFPPFLVPSSSGNTLQTVAALSHTLLHVDTKSQGYSYTLKYQDGSLQIPPFRKHSSYSGNAFPYS